MIQFTRSARVTRVWTGLREIIEPSWLSLWCSIRSGICTASGKRLQPRSPRSFHGHGPLSLCSDPEADGFRFYAIATTLAQEVLQRNAMVPRVGSAMGWVYHHKALHIRPDLTREQVFLEDKLVCSGRPWTHDQSAASRRRQVSRRSQYCQYRVGASRSRGSRVLDASGECRSPMRLIMSKRTNRSIDCETSLSGKTSTSPKNCGSAKNVGSLVGKSHAFQQVV